MKKTIILDDTMEKAGQRFIDAWHRAERGEKTEPQSVVAFIAFGTLLKVMTDKRHALLKHLRRRPEANVRALAAALKRDYKNVYEDVKALESIGLIDRHGKKLSTPYDEIRSSLTT